MILNLDQKLIETGEGGCNECDFMVSFDTLRGFINALNMHRQEFHPQMEYPLIKRASLDRRGNLRLS